MTNRYLNAAMPFSMAILLGVFLCCSACSQKKKAPDFTPVALFPGFEEIAEEEYAFEPISFENTATNSEAVILHSIQNTSFHLYNAAAFTSLEKGLMVGGTGLRIRTTLNGGKVWKEIKLSGFADAFQSVAFSNGEAYVVGEGSYIVKGDSELSNWAVFDTKSLEGLQETDQKFYKIKFKGQLGFAMGVTSRIGFVAPCIVRTLDGGRTWNNIALKGLEKEETPITDFDMVSEKLIYAVTASGKAYKSLDGGFSWKVFFETSDTEYPSLNSIDFKDKNTGYIGGLASLLYFTKDAGSQWKPIKLTTDEKDLNISDIQYLSPNRVAINTAKSFQEGERPLFAFLLDGDGAETAQPLLTKNDSTIFFKGDAYHLFILNKDHLFLTDRNNLYLLNTSTTASE